MVAHLDCLVTVTGSQLEQEDNWAEGTTIFEKTTDGVVVTLDDEYVIPRLYFQGSTEVVIYLKCSFIIMSVEKE